MSIPAAARSIRSKSAPVGGGGRRQTHALVATSVVRERDGVVRLKRASRVIIADSWADFIAQQELYREKDDTTVD